MKIFVKISSTLRPYVPGYEPETGLWVNGDTLPAQPTASSLALAIGLPLAEIKFVMINGRQRPMDTLLNANDRVAYFPAVGGG